MRTTDPAAAPLLTRLEVGALAAVGVWLAGVAALILATR